MTSEVMRAVPAKAAAKPMILNSVLFSVGRADNATEEDDLPKMREKMTRKALAAEAKSRGLKVGSKSSKEIRRMLEKEKRTDRN